MIETARAVAYPWQCDGMGHFSTPFYMQVFDVATYHLFAQIGMSSAAMAGTQRGWADVRHEIDYRKEIHAGALLLVRSGLTAVGGKSLKSVHHLIDADTDAVSAVLNAVTVYFDLEARRATEFSAETRERLQAFVMVPA